VDVSIDRMTFYADQLATAPHRIAPRRCRLPLPTSKVRTTLRQ
jgi:hypothetical protein